MLSRSSSLSIPKCLGNCYANDFITIIFILTLWRKQCALNYLLVKVSAGPVGYCCLKPFSYLRIYCKHVGRELRVTQRSVGRHCVFTPEHNDLTCEQMWQMCSCKSQLKVIFALEVVQSYLWVSSEFDLPRLTPCHWHNIVKSGRIYLSVWDMILLLTNQQRLTIREEQTWESVKVIVRKRKESTEDGWPGQAASTSLTSLHRVQL